MTEFTALEYLIDFYCIQMNSSVPQKKEEYFFILDRMKSIGLTDQNEIDKFIEKKFNESV